PEQGDGGQAEERIGFGFHDRCGGDFGFWILDFGFWIGERGRGSPKEGGAMSVPYPEDDDFSESVYWPIGQWAFFMEKQVSGQ
ncbi:MAG: hypothetical protein WCJ14_13255, partial [Verrucomicrobiota bacterium]